MTKPRKKQGNPDFRHRVTSPAPTSEEIESRLIELVTPGTFANLKGVKDKERSLRVGVARRRHRVLTLPVMAAIVLSLVYRQIHYLTDVLRCLEVEGLLWVEAMSVSRQALSQRLESLPAELFIKLFEQVVERLAVKKNRNEIRSIWAPVAEEFAAVWIADASTLEAVKKHLGQLQQKTGAVLGGKMLMVVEAFSHRPVTAFFDVICIADVGELRMHFYSQNGYWVYLISGLAALMVYRCKSMLLGFFTPYLMICALMLRRREAACLWHRFTAANRSNFCGNGVPQFVFFPSCAMPAAGFAYAQLTTTTHSLASRASAFYGLGESLSPTTSTQRRQVA